MPMGKDKQEAIRKKATELDNELKSLKNKIKRVEQHKRQIQSLCDHPNKFKYTAQGDMGWRCPDCDWQS